MSVLSRSDVVLGWEDKFPAKGRAGEMLEFLVQYADMAPSAGKTRPWNFQVENDVAHLYLDTSRARRSGDPELRELIIICGGALGHLRVAARHFGHQAVIDAFPSGESNLLARVTLDGPVRTEELNTIMFYAIHKWGNAPRALSAGKKIPGELLDELHTLGNTEHSWLSMAREPESRDAYAGFLAEGEWACKKRKEILERQLKDTGPLHRRKEERPSLNQLAGRISSLFHRTKDEELVVSTNRKHLAEAEPVLAIFGTYGDSPADWLEAGEQLAALLLRGLAVGVRPSLLNHPVQDTDLRGALVRKLRLPGHPQMMFRIGFPESADVAQTHAAGTVQEELL